MKILITDDSKATRMRLGIAIKDRGHEIVTATNGKEALDILQSDDPPEIAFVDWEMPEMEGLEALQIVRKQVRDSDIHRVRTYVILITARSTPEDISLALISGADDYMTKPWNKQELNARLEVAERTVSLQQSLKHRVLELESILHRHNLQGEIPAHSRETEGTQNDANGDTEHSSEDKLQCLHSVIDLLRHGVDAFNHLNVGAANVALHKSGSGGDPLTHIAWVPFILRKQKLWVDMVFELDNRSAMLFFQASQNKLPADDSELNTYLSTVFHVVASSLKPIFGVSTKFIILPALSFARSRHAAPDYSKSPLKQFEITIGEVRILLTITETPLTKAQLSLTQVRQGHVLAEPLSSVRNPGSHIIEKYIAIDEQYMEKLKRSMKNDFAETSATVYEPSPIALQILN